VVVAALLGAARPGAADSIAQVRSDADWILAAQLPDGAIANHVDRRAIWPYLANYAAIGLARAAQVTGGARYSDAAWRWLRWYQAHQDASGFVTDYNVAADSESSTGLMDSTDAYAGTFLTATRAFWDATHDRPRLRGLKRGIVAAVAAIKATQEADGLTWAKPAWHVKYLMDQAEAYRGLRDAASLAGALGAANLVSVTRAESARLRQGVQGLWNEGAGAYDWALHEGGSRHPTNWDILYPDAMEQVWAVASGLASGPRAQQLMRHFAAAQPSWDQPTALARYDSGVGPVGYWPLVARGFALTGDHQLASIAVTRLRANALATARAWPFTPADAGQLITLTEPSNARASAHRRLRG
jgi:hypothetical protein